VPEPDHHQEAAVSDEISIQFTRFSAFYSPLIATIAGGFLAEEGCGIGWLLGRPGRPVSGSGGYVKVPRWGPMRPRPRTALMLATLNGIVDPPFLPNDGVSTKP
jgi:hypothetical protein